MNHYIPILGGYFDYCIRSSIRFPILILLVITYNYWFSFALLMSNSSLVISLIILLGNVFFCCVIILQLGTWRILNIISRPKNKFPGLAFNIVWYVLHILYATADSTPVYSNYKSSGSSHPLLHATFANVWCIISTI